jgi:hypothetical protein
MDALFATELSNSGSARRRALPRRALPRTPRTPHHAPSGPFARVGALPVPCEGHCAAMDARRSATDSGGDLLSERTPPRARAHGRECIPRAGADGFDVGASRRSAGACVRRTAAHF